MGDIVYGYGPPFPFGSIDWPTPFAFPHYQGVDPLNLGSHEGLAYLLSGSPFDSALSTTLQLPLPFGEADYPTPMQFAYAGRAPTIYPAATIGRSSSPTDTPANTYVPPKLKAGLNYAMALFAGADPMSAGSAAIGVLELIDPDGELDGLLSLGWDGAPLTLSRGDPTAAFSTWSVVANVSAAGILYDQRKKEIKLRDLAWQLNAAPLHGIRYGGTGGVDGDATLVGRIKPYAVGTFSGATPVQIGASLLCYQVSCSSVSAFTAIKDGGNPLTFDGDDPDYATLAAATITLGHYRTCKALGLFRLGGAPTFIVTVDGIGDADTLNGLATPSTRAQIARRIATGRGSVRLDDATQIDSAAYVALENRQSGACGYYWDGEITKGAALTEVMSGCLGWWLMRLTGQLALGQIEDPALSTPYLSLSFPASGAGEIRLGEPSMTDFQVQRRATYVGWSRNYTPLQTNQIAGIVAQADAAILMAVARYASSQDAWVANSYPTSPAVYVNGNFALLADAQVEGDRQQALMRTRRERWQVPVVIDPLADVVGRVVNIANFNRFGFGASKNFLCVGITANSGPTITLELWG